VLGTATAAVLAVSQALVGASAGTAASQGIRPNAVGELDCNGFSHIQRPVSRTMLCTDIRGLYPGQRFYDNGHYIGHDEPSIRFLSHRPGSGNNVTFTERLGRDPAALPTTRHPGHDITHYFELSPAPWFGMTICDPRSYPQTPCRPNSDANAPHPGLPNGGGAAFMEMQFYPPGDAPRVDSISCNNAHWCAALTIDSLEANKAKKLNNKCIEPVNFAFIQRNGVPAGPPGPPTATLATFTPNKQTLMMNPGDVVSTHMWDAAIGGGQHAFKVTIHDLTTHQSGFMVASAANGFMNTSFSNCHGHPFNFQPMYNTARPQNSITWSVLQSGILTQFEIGHFIPCTTVSHPVKLEITTTVFDKTWLFCHGAYENAGPPDSKPRANEPTDGLCYKKGFTHGMFAVPPNEVTGCEDNLTQNGDLDFDGTPYYRDWPDSRNPGRFPSPFLQQQPTTHGARYPFLQFETDVPASEFNTCVPGNLKGCAVPPPGAPGHFYPFYTQAMVGGHCVWEFGNMHNGATFGGDAQYAHLIPHGFFKGQFDLSSFPRKNPQC
jgi:hypothetical protein